MGALIYYQIKTPQWDWTDLLRINGFTLLIWVTVTFFSAIVNTYSNNYLKGFKYHKRFTLLSLGFTGSVMVFVMSNHILALLLSWFAMGVFMARLIGVNSDWERQERPKNFLKNFF